MRHWPIGVDWTIAVEPQRLNRPELPRCVSLGPVITGASHNEG